MKKLMIIMLLFVFASGCSSFGKRDIKVVQIEKRVEPVEVLHPPLPDPLIWERVKWKVLTLDLMRELVKRVDSGELSERDAVFFAVTPKGYENLSVNMAEIKRLIEGQKSVIIYYKTTVPDTIFLPAENPDE